MDARDSTRPALFYTEIPPAPALAGWVQTCWCFLAPDDLAGVYPHRVLPDGCVSLVWTPSADVPGGLLIATGPRLRAFEVPVRAGDRFYGARLQPGVARPLLEPGSPAPWPDLQGLHTMLAALAPARAEALHARLAAADGTEEVVRAFEAAVQAWIPHAAPPDDQVRRAVRHLADGRARISDLADRVALSERQLQRRFRHAVGLTPKQYARVRRFRTTLVNVLRAVPETWGRVAAECGFTDQAHMTREFVAFFGASPEALRAHLGPIAHGDVIP